MDPPDGEPRGRAADWFRATPLELIGLAVLLTGALVASWALWWSATGRPGDLPSAALQVGVGNDRGEPAVPGAGPTVGAAPSAPDTEDEAEGGGADGPDHDVAPVELTVHVTGAVAAPGLVVVGAGARVGDAVQAAGGLSVAADPELVNLARVLTDGEHVHIPRQGEDPVPDPGPSSDGAGAAGPVAADGRLDLNRATAAELETLPGIGPARADAIVGYREANGPFAVPGDLRRVSGIGEATFQGVADLVTVE